MTYPGQIYDGKRRLHRTKLDFHVGWERQPTIRFSTDPGRDNRRTDLNGSSLYRQSVMGCPDCEPLLIYVIYTCIPVSHGSKRLQNHLRQTLSNKNQVKSFSLSVTFHPTISMSLSDIHRVTLSRFEVFLSHVCDLSDLSLVYITFTIISSSSSVTSSPPLPFDQQEIIQMITKNPLQLLMLEVYGTSVCLL